MAEFRLIIAIVWVIKMAMSEEKYIEMCKFEREYAACGAKIIGGIDEAGRGPLAGPVVAGCVFFSADCKFPMADDSKKLSEAKREALYDDIINNCLAWGVGIIDNTTIDEVNILKATHMAMHLACENAMKMLAEKQNGAGLSSWDVIFIDHVKLDKMPCKTVSITHGDALSVSIAAASIIAKVTRDRMMVEYDSKYPGYGFAGHKGYGTKKHYDAIRSLGYSDIHRRSFLKNFEM